MMKTDKILLSFYILLSVLLISCNDDDDDNDPDTSGQTKNTVVDIDGNQYDIIEIDVNAIVKVYPNDIEVTSVPTVQRWLKQNLRTTTLNDGVPLILNEGDENMGSFHYCWYDNSEEFAKESLGAIYHESVVNSEKLCPVGWRVPTDEDWLALEFLLGLGDENLDDLLDSDFRGDSASYKLKEMNSTFWDLSNEFSNDIYGFRLRGGGYRANRLTSQLNSYYNDIGESTMFYTSTSGEFNPNGFILRAFDDNYGGISRFEPSYFLNFDGEMLFSAYVRCVEDTP